MIAWSIPSPDQGVWHLGPLPLRAYAICIILGIVLAIWVGQRRWSQRGGADEQISDMALWAVPFGVVGARVYHVITDHQLYFGSGRDPLDALRIWQGGLGVWGAIAGGALGAAIYARRHRIRIRVLADALAPALLLAQAVGRLGNYFNQELFGRPTDLPWGLEISPEHRPEGYADAATFHPTFLYELTWNTLAALLLVWLDRRFRLGWGRCFALYVMLYCAGRAWIENLRIDSVEYDDVLGLRLNVWTSLILFAAAAIYFVVMTRRHPGREESPYLEVKHHEANAPA